MAAQVTSNPTALHFGRIVIGQSESLPASLTNTESTSVTISALSSTSNEFQVTGLNLPLTLSAGQTVAFNVTFAPTTTGWEGGTLAFTSNATNKTIYLQIGGLGVTSASVVPNPSSLGFGSVAVGSTATLPIGLTNSGSTGLALMEAQVTGAGFSLSGVTFPLILSPSQTVTLNVTFTPQTASTIGGTLVVPNAALTIPLSGTGTTNAQLVLSPTAMNFGNVDIGNTSTQPVTLSATGSAVTVSSSSSSSSQFALQGASFPLTIAAGKSVSFNVAFTPNTSGKVAGNLSLASNASDSNAQEGLSGVGITPTHSVTVSWNPSVSQVAGYNVYRGLSQNSYSKVNNSLNSGTTYTDSTVSSGQTYFYVATAVTSTGQESTYSSPVQAVVP